MIKPRSILIVEELLMLILSIFAFSQLSYAWWIFPLTLLIPDIGMIGYLINNKYGAGLYNVFHHKGIALILFAFGYYYHVELVQLSGVILFGHASMDRIFGFGLKLEEGFKYTHLGKLK